MTIDLHKDEFGRLTCELFDDKTHAIITASNSAEAHHGLLDAIRSVRSTGNGECYWNEASGQYRWVLRKLDAGQLRIAILWSTGTVTGWEHAFWSEAPLDAFTEAIEAGLLATSPEWK